MTDQPGFPAGVRFTPVPDPFIKLALLEMDAAELKASLYVIWLLHQKKGYPQFVTLDELLADPVLVRGLARPDLPGDEALRLALAQAVSRGTFLKAPVVKDGDRRELFFLNSEAGRKALWQIQIGKLPLGRPLRTREAPPEMPNIFKLYEENIGLLTPIMTDELQEAEKTYPASWIQEAFEEAVALNKRNWRYISRILERWAQEGKDRGKPGRYPQAASRT